MRNVIVECKEPTHNIALHRSHHTIHRYSAKQCGSGVATSYYLVPPNVYTTSHQWQDAVKLSGAAFAIFCVVFCSVLAIADQIKITPSECGSERTGSDAGSPTRSEGEFAVSLPLPNQLEKMMLMMQDLNSSLNSKIGDTNSKTGEISRQISGEVSIKMEK